MFSSLSILVSLVTVTKGDIIRVYDSECEQREESTCTGVCEWDSLSYACYAADPCTTYAHHECVSSGGNPSLACSWDGSRCRTSTDKAQPPHSPTDTTNKTNNTRNTVNNTTHTHRSAEWYSIDSTAVTYCSQYDNNSADCEAVGGLECYYEDGLCLEKVLKEFTTCEAIEDDRLGCIDVAEEEDCYYDYYEGKCLTFSSCSQLPVGLDIEDHCLAFAEKDCFTSGDECKTFINCPDAVDACDQFSSQCYYHDGECLEFTSRTVCSELVEEGACMGYNAAVFPDILCVFWSGECLVSDECEDHLTEDACNQIGASNNRCDWDSEQESCVTFYSCESTSASACNNYYDRFDCLVNIETGLCEDFKDLQDCQLIGEDVCDLFDMCVWDADNGCMYNDTCEVYLTPKDCAVVSHIGCVFNSDTYTCVRSSECSDYSADFCPVEEVFHPTCKLDEDDPTLCVPRMTCDVDEEIACYRSMELYEDLGCYWDGSNCNQFSSCDDLSSEVCELFLEDYECHISATEDTCVSFSTCEDVPGDTCDTFSDKFCIFDKADDVCVQDPICYNYGEDADSCATASRFGCVFGTSSCEYSSECSDYSVDYCPTAKWFTLAACVADEGNSTCILSEVCEDYIGIEACAFIKETNEDCFFDTAFCQTFSSCENIPESVCDEFMDSYDCHISVSDNKCSSFSTCDEVPASNCTDFTDKFCMLEFNACVAMTTCDSYSTSADDCATMADIGCVFDNNECVYSDKCSDYGVEICPDAGQFNSNIGCVVNPAGTGCVPSDICEEYNSEEGCEVISSTNLDCYFSEGNCLTFSSCAYLIDEDSCNAFGPLRDCHLDINNSHSCVEFTTCEAVPNDVCSEFSDNYCASDGTSCSYRTNCLEYNGGGAEACLLAADYGCVFENSDCVYSSKCSDYSIDYCDSAGQYDIGCTVSAEDSCVESTICEDYWTEDGCTLISSTNDQCFWEDECTTFSTCGNTPAYYCDNYTVSESCHLDLGGDTCQQFSSCDEVSLADCGNFYEDYYCVSNGTKCMKKETCNYYMGEGECADASEFGCIFDTNTHTCVYSDLCSDYSVEFCLEATDNQPDIGCEVNRNSCVVSETCADYITETGCTDVALMNDSCFFDGTVCFAFEACSDFDEVFTCSQAARFGCVFDPQMKECVYSTECGDYPPDKCLGAAELADTGCKLDDKGTSCVDSDECGAYLTEVACDRIQESNRHCFWNPLTISCDLYDGCLGLDRYGCNHNEECGCVFDDALSICGYSSECEDYSLEYCPSSSNSAYVSCAIYHDQCRPA